MSTNWYIECGAFLPNGRFTRNHMMTLDKVNSFRFKYNNTGVFTTAYIYDSKEQNEANLLGDFYLDLDYDLDTGDKEAAFNVVRQDVFSVLRYFKAIMDIEPRGVDIFFSGSKGIHIIVSKDILGIKPDKHLNRYYKMMAEDIKKYTSGNTIDLKIYDNKRLLRMPNSIHQKTKLYKIYLYENEIKELSFEQIRKLAEEPRPIPKREHKINPRASAEMQNYIKKFEMMVNRVRANVNINAKLDYIPPCVEYLFSNTIGAGQRNMTVAFLASYLRQAGFTEKQAINKMHMWNESNCDPKLPEREIEITVTSIYNGEAKMGCSTAKVLGRCDEQNCLISKRKRG